MSVSNVRDGGCENELGGFHGNLQASRNLPVCDFFAYADRLFDLIAYA
jgi:hypothetical protein